MGQSAAQFDHEEGKFMGMLGMEDGQGLQGWEGILPWSLVLQEER